VRLSEAILLGSVGTGQAFGEYVDKKGNTCALGAALCAIGKLTDLSEYTINLGLAWPYHKMSCIHPIAGIKMSMVHIITHLNDIEGWSRPQIAAWVAEQEVRLGLDKEEQVGVKESEYARP